MRIGAVVVTYNRLTILKQTLDAYTKQIRKPDVMIIVDNASTDNTADFLSHWKTENSNLFEVHVIHMKKNMGGSGGFHEGLRYGLELGLDWIWVSDDDAIPRRDTISLLTNYIENAANLPVALCSAVYGPDGKIDLMHRRRIGKGIRYREVVVPEHEYEFSEFSLDLFSYVGTMIRSSALEIVGLTEKDYFIFYDDTEHSLRLSKEGQIICIPKSVIDHKVKMRSISGPSWKMYYGIRNRLVLLKKHYPIRFAIEILILNIKLLAKKILHRNSDIIPIYREAMKDALKGKLGLHELYKPGWQPGVNA